MRLILTMMLAVVCGVAISAEPPQGAIDGAPATANALLQQLDGLMMHCRKQGQTWDNADSLAEYTEGLKVDSALRNIRGRLQFESSAQITQLNQQEQARERAANSANQAARAAHEKANAQCKSDALTQGKALYVEFKHRHRKLAHQAAPAMAAWLADMNNPSLANDSAWQSAKAQAAVDALN